MREFKPKRDWKVGDEASFYISGDETGVIDLTGEILRIDGDFATMRHEWGECRVHLSILKPAEG